MSSIPRKKGHPSSRSLASSPSSRKEPFKPKTEVCSETSKDAKTLAMGISPTVEDGLSLRGFLGLPGFKAEKVKRHAVK